MSKVTVTEGHLSDIANAIRGKLGVATTYKPGQMAAAIAAIPTGGSATLITKSITANGTYDAEDDDADGYSSVTVNVPGSSSIIDGGSFSFVENDLKDVKYSRPSYFFYDYTQNSDATAYLVVKATNYGYPQRILAFRYSGSNGNEPMFLVMSGNGNIGYTTYGVDTTLQNAYAYDLHVYAISVNNTTKKAKFYLDGVYIDEKTYNNSANLSYCGSGGGSLGDKDVYYMACVYGVQSDETIISNCQILMQKYNVGGA